MCPRTFRFEKKPFRCGSSSGLQQGSGTSLMWYVWMKSFYGLGAGLQPLRMLEGNKINTRVIVSPLKSTPYHPQDRVHCKKITILFLLRAVRNQGDDVFLIEQGGYLLFDIQSMLLVNHRMAANRPVKQSITSRHAIITVIHKMIALQPCVTNSFICAQQQVLPDEERLEREGAGAGVDRVRQAAAEAEAAQRHEGPALRRVPQTQHQGHCHRDPLPLRKPKQETHGPCQDARRLRQRTTPTKRAGKPETGTSASRDRAQDRQLLSQRQMKNHSCSLLMRFLFLRSSMRQDSGRVLLIFWMTPTTRELGHMVCSIFSASASPIHCPIFWWYRSVFSHSLHSTRCFFTICSRRLMGLVLERPRVAALGKGKRMLSVTEMLKSLWSALARSGRAGTGTLSWASVWIIVDSFTLDSALPQRREAGFWALERASMALKLLEVELQLEFLPSLTAFCEYFRKTLLFLRFWASPWGSSQSASRFSYLGAVIILRLRLLGSPPSLLVSFRSHCGTWLSSWLKRTTWSWRALICELIFAQMSFGFVRVRLLSARNSYCSISERIIPNIIITQAHQSETQTVPSLRTASGIISMHNTTFQNMLLSSPNLDRVIATHFGLKHVDYTLVLRHSLQQPIEHMAHSSAVVVLRVRSGDVGQTGHGQLLGMVPGWWAYLVLAVLVLGLGVRFFFFLLPDGDNDVLCPLAAECPAGVEAVLEAFGMAVGRSPVAKPQGELPAVREGWGKQGRECVDIGLQFCDVEGGTANERTKRAPVLQDTLRSVQPREEHLLHEGPKQTRQLPFLAHITVISYNLCPRLGSFQDFTQIALKPKYYFQGLSSKYYNVNLLNYKRTPVHVKKVGSYRIEMKML